MEGEENLSMIRAARMQGGGHTCTYYLLNERREVRYGRCRQKFSITFKEFSRVLLFDRTRSSGVGGFWYNK